MSENPPRPDDLASSKYHAKAHDVSGFTFPPRQEGPQPAFKPEPELAELLAAQPMHQTEPDPSSNVQHLDMSKLRADYDKLVAEKQAEVAKSEPQTSLLGRFRKMLAGN